MRVQTWRRKVLCVKILKAFGKSSAGMILAMTKNNWLGKCAMCSDSVAIPNPIGITSKDIIRNIRPSQMSMCLHSISTIVIASTVFDSVESPKRPRNWTMKKGMDTGVITRRTATHTLTLMPMVMLTNTRTLMATDTDISTIKPKSLNTKLHAKACTSFAPHMPVQIHQCTNHRINSHTSLSLVIWNQLNRPSYTIVFRLSWCMLMQPSRFTTKLTPLPPAKIGHGSPVFMWMVIFNVWASYWIATGF